MSSMIHKIFCFVCVTILSAATFGLASEVSTSELNCPQCGLWRITSAQIEGFVGEAILIDENNISIPGCGTFSYTVIPNAERAKGDRYYTYKLSIPLKQNSESFLCERRGLDDWNLDIIVSGWFAEGGRADFSLRRGTAKDKVLEMRGWNKEREDPCDNGSNMATADCLALNRALLLKLLANASLEKKSTNKPSSFNFTRFASSVKAYCEVNEEIAWSVVGCENDILAMKYEEFRTWKSCVTQSLIKGTPKGKCKYPNEAFNRKQKEQE